MLACLLDLLLYVCWKSYISFYNNVYIYTQFRGGCVQYVTIVCLYSRMRKNGMATIPNDLRSKKLSFDMVYEL